MDFFFRGGGGGGGVGGLIVKFYITKISSNPDPHQSEIFFFFFFFFCCCFFPPQISVSTDDCPRKTCSRVLCYIIRKDSFSHFFYHGSPYSIPPSPTPSPQYQTLVFSLLFHLFFLLLCYITRMGIFTQYSEDSHAHRLLFSPILHTYVHNFREKKVKKNLIPNFCCNQCHVTMFSTQWRLQMSFQRWLVFIRNILTIRKVRRNF